MLAIPLRQDLYHFSFSLSKPWPYHLHLLTDRYSDTYDKPQNLTMKLTTIIMILLIPSSSTLVVSSHLNDLKSTMPRSTGKVSGYCTSCPNISARPAFFAHYRALKRARKDDLSVSLDASLPSSPSYGSRSDNTTNTTTDVASLPSWSPSIDTIVTAIFRALLTVLTLFNVNITWRIHGKSSYLKSPPTHV